jgi:hypothetical protein
MAPTPLEKLPKEIWLLVLENLSFEDLFNASLASRDLRASAEPYLYRSIHWDWSDPPLEQILMLLRTIADRPYIANYIRHLTMKNWKAPFYGEEQLHIGRTEKKQWMKLHQRFRPTTRWARILLRGAKYPPKVEKEWVHLLAEGDAYAYATVLLSLSHNLRSLRLDFAFITERGLPGQMLHHSLFGNAPTGVLTKFTKLEMVDYGGNVPLVGFEGLRDFGKNYQFMPWFHLPSVRILEIWMPHFEGIPWLTDPSPILQSPSLLSLRSLIVSRSSVTAGELATLLSKVPTLSSVHVGLAYRCVAANDFFKESEHLVRALEAKRKTLEHLSISVEILPGCSDNFHLDLDENSDTEPFLGFLKKFPKLKSVELPYTFLFGWSGDGYTLREALPKTIEVVHIRSDFWPQWSLQHLSTLLDRAVLDMLSDVPPFLQSLWRFSYQGPSIEVDYLDEGYDDIFEIPELHEEAYYACYDGGISLEARSRYWMPGDVVMRGQWPEGYPSDVKLHILGRHWPWECGEETPRFIWSWGRLDD